MSKSIRKDELLKELQDLEATEADETVNIPDLSPAIDSCIVSVEKVQAPKKPRTEKQIAVFQKATEVRKANEANRRAEREIQAAEDKKALEDKLVKSAIAIKKRQIKKEQLIEQIAEPAHVQKAKPDPDNKPQLLFKFY